MAPHRRGGGHPSGPPNRSAGSPGPGSPPGARCAVGWIRESTRLKVTVLELKKKSVTSGVLDSLMPAILGAWAEREGWRARVRYVPFEAVDWEDDCDLLAISSYTNRAPLSYEVARRFRARGVPVAFGGPHTKGNLDDVRRHADAVFRHCDEEAWRGFLRRVERGEAGRSDPGVFVPSAQLVEPPPFREYARFFGRRKFPIVTASVGCPYTCGFCSDWDLDFKRRPIEAVLEDVAAVDAPLFFFADPNFGANPVATRELLRRMAPLGKRFFVNYSFSYLNEEVLPLLRDAGCFMVGIGLDSLTTSYKKNAMGRAESILDDAVRRIEVIKRYVPLVSVNIILGLDADTDETFDAVRELHRRADADIVMPHIATPFPGTPLYDEMKAAGRIFDWNEERYDTQHLVITLRGMEVARFHDRFRRLQAELCSPWNALGKSFRQLLTSRDPRRAAFLLAVLGRKALSAPFHELPDIERSKRRILADPAYARARSGERVAPARPTALGFARA